MPCAFPGTDRTRVAAETMRGWIADYRRGGFEALYPKPRTDRGKPRRLPAEVAARLIALKTENPGWSVRIIIEAAHGEGIDHLPLAHEARRLAQHGRLARARMALHAHDALAREQDRADRFAPAFRQRAGGEFRLHRHLFRRRLPGFGTLPHPGDIAALGPERPVGDEGAVRPAQFRFNQMTVTAEAFDRRLRLLDRIPPGRLAERMRRDVARREYRRPLLQMLHRPPDRFVDRQNGARLLLPPVPPFAPCPRRCLARRPAGFAGAAAPYPPQQMHGRLRLAPPRIKRRLLRPRRAVGTAPFLYVLQYVAAPGRERVAHFPVIARKLEARHRPDINGTVS